MTSTNVVYAISKTVFPKVTENQDAYANNSGIVIEVTDSYRDTSISMVGQKNKSIMKTFTSFSNVDLTNDPNTGVSNYSFGTNAGSVSLFQPYTNNYLISNNISGKFPPNQQDVKCVFQHDNMKFTCRSRGIRSQLVLDNCRAELSFCIQLRNPAGNFVGPCSNTKVKNIYFKWQNNELLMSGNPNTGFVSGECTLSSATSPYLEGNKLSVAGFDYSQADKFGSFPESQLQTAGNYNLILRIGLKYYNINNEEITDQIYYSELYHPYHVSGLLLPLRTAIGVDTTGYLFNSSFDLPVGIFEKINAT